MNAEQKRAVAASVRFWCQSPEFRRVARFIDSAAAGHGDVGEVLDEITANLKQILIDRAKTQEFPIASAVR